MLWQHNKQPSSFKKTNIQQHEELMKQIWVSSVFERCLLICSRPCLQNHKMLRGRSGYWLKAQMIRVKCTTRKALFPSKGKAPNPKRKEKITVMRTVLLLAFASLFFFLNLFFLFLKLSERICHQAAVNLWLLILMPFLVTSVQLWLDSCLDSIKLGWVVTLNKDVLLCCC